MRFDWRDILGVIAPAVCQCCGRGLVTGEKIVCAHCLADIDTAWPAGDTACELRERIGPRTAPVAAVSAWALYTHNSVVGRLIRKGKYDDRPDILARLADMYAAEFAPTPAAADIDVLMPVPMHWWNRLMRGCDHTRVIADTIGRRLGIPVADNLHTTRRRHRQAGMRRADRLRGAQGAFAVADPDALAGLHVAVVDDIITTGATATAAVEALALGAAPRAISVLALAATVRR